MDIPVYIIDLQNAYLKNANPGLAIQMSKYMKDKFAFFGIKSPERKDIYKAHWKDHGYIPIDDMERVVKWSWKANQREFQYFAMETLGRTSKKADVDHIKIYEYMITHKSWWDTIDFIASNLVGAYFTKYPDQVKKTTSKWMNSNNMWLQRTCILFQLKYKEKTDTALLEVFIKSMLDSKEFFIRKAIGWALREYSKTNPEYVIQFVDNHQLSGLSEREALKWIKNKSVTN